jgi:hypothetical protein
MTTTYHVAVTITAVTEWQDGASRRWITKKIQENVIASERTAAKAKRIGRALQDRAQDCIEEVR